MPVAITERNDEGAKVGTDDYVDDSNGTEMMTVIGSMRIATVLSQRRKRPHS